jgi:3-hydroxybutyryl-CoA dehydrogenase
MKMTTIRNIGVVGAGTMGRGIAQLFAQAGHTVHCYDAIDGAAERGVSVVRATIDRLLEKGKLEAGATDAIKTAIRICTRLDELAGCDLVIEAIVEDLAVKRELFRALEDIVGDSTLLASNTSSLVISEIAAGCRHPHRIAGLHFFNPVPLMKVAEVIAAERTAPATVASLKVCVEGAGHRAVVAADQPGFLVNHAGRGLYTEGLRVLEEQVASAHEIDTLMREAAGFRMGPFELLDLTGLDVSGKVMESIYQQFHQEPRFRPSSLVAPRIAAGLLGRKTGEGWYHYVEGSRQAVPRTAPPPMPAGPRIWIDPAAAQRVGLASLCEQAGAVVVSEDQAADVLIVQPWGADATSYCARQGLDPQRAVAVDPAPGLPRHRSLMITSVTHARVRDTAHALLAADGTPVTVINDSPGFVVQRIVATIVNIAANIVQRGIASVDDLEDAVRLGLGYPMGPLALGDSLGASRILDILAGMHALTGDPRYRPSPWLRRRAVLGLSLLTPEAARA